MSKLVGRLLFGFVVFCAAVFQRVSGQTIKQPPTVTHTTYDRARQVLEASMNALGGHEALKLTERVYIREAGVAPMVFQSRSVSPPFDEWNYEETSVFDIVSKQAFREYKFTNPKSRQQYQWWVRTVFSGDTKYESIVQMDAVMPLPDATLDDHRSTLARLPQNIVAEALSRLSTARWLGTHSYDGRPHEIVAYSPPRGRPQTLYIDAKTNLLSKFEYIYTRNTVGDATREVIFLEYKETNGILLPWRRILRDAGYILADLKRTDIRINYQPPDTLFAAPAKKAYNIIPPVQETKKLADGVFVIGDIPGGYNVLVVEFKDFLLVAEAPEDNFVSNLAERILTNVKEISPGKPVRYAVPTHHHSDHASGVRAYMAEGTTIITTPGNKEFFEQLAVAPYTITPDSLARAPRSPVIETVSNKRRVIQDNTQTVELYDVGPLTHANEMLVVYLPKQKILYQSDLFNPVVPGKDTVTSDMIWHGIDRGDTEDLLKAINKLKLDVKTIIGVHGRTSTLEELTEWVNAKK